MSWQDSDKAFERWIENLRERRLVPFGTAYELFAKKAWEAGAEWQSGLAENAKDTRGA